MRVAFLGLGRMGAPMAARVAAVHPTTVWNRTARPAAVPAGAAVARTPAEAVAAADVAITMVADAAALDTVLGGPDGVLAGLAPGSVLVDMSTIGPEAARAVAARCAVADVGFVDAPVSGSVGLATAGELLVMAGGEAALLAWVEPVLRTMAKAVVPTGAVGAGAAMKVAVNLALAVTSQAVAEALAVTTAAGIDPERAYDVLQGGALGSPYVRYKRAAFLDPEGTPVAFTIDLMAKDVALALALAHEVGVTAAAGETAASTLTEASAEGRGDADVSRVLA